MNKEQIIRPIRETEYIRHWTKSDKYIVINCSYFEYELSDDIINKFVGIIKDEIRDTNKNYICFNVCPEGMPFGAITTIDKIAKSFIVNENFSPEQFLIIFGGSVHPSNYSYYLKSVEQFDWIKLPVIFMNNYEMMFRSKITQNLSIYERINQYPKIKNKKFLCYNRNVKAHRIYLTAMMLSKNILDQGYFSMYIHGGPEHGMSEHSRYNFRDLEKYFPRTWEDAVNVIENNIERFPIALSLGPNNAHNMHEITPEDLHHYDDAYFGIITETKFFHDNPNDLQMLKTDLSLDGYLFSEKTYKFIAGRLPFILVGFTGSLQALRDLGYKTFHPYINEDYDLIDNDEERMIAINTEIERLSNLSDDKWILIQERLKEVVDYNFNVLLSATPKRYSL